MIIHHGTLLIYGWNNLSKNEAHYCYCCQKLSYGVGGIHRDGSYIGLIS